MTEEEIIEMNRVLAAREIARSAPLTEEGLRVYQDAVKNRKPLCYNPLPLDQPEQES